MLRKAKKSFARAAYLKALAPFIFPASTSRAFTPPQNPIVRNLNQDTITQAVLARLAQTPDARLKELMTNLVQHLHAFARETRLTEAEWLQGMAFLTATGQQCSGQRQEFVLLSDVLGLSTLTIAQNHDKPAGCTEATVFGPFHVAGAPHYELGDDVANGAAGQPCLVRGQVRSLDGQAIAGAEIEVWQADAEGHYDVQKPGLDHHQARGFLKSGTQGEFFFKTIVAEAYPVPTDGPVGELLAATGRHPWRPAHLHFIIKAPGFQSLVTHVFRSGDQYLDSDAVFGVRQSLVADWVAQADGSYVLDFDFILNKADA